MDTSTTRQIPVHDVSDTSNIGIGRRDPDTRVPVGQQSDIPVSQRLKDKIYEMTPESLKSGQLGQQIQEKLQSMEQVRGKMQEAFPVFGEAQTPYQRENIGKFGNTVSLIGSSIALAGTLLALTGAGVTAAKLGWGRVKKWYRDKKYKRGLRGNQYGSDYGYGSQYGSDRFGQGYGRNQGLESQHSYGGRFGDFPQR